MAKFRKRILQSGKYESPDRSIEVTPERLSHWEETFNRMKESKIGIPISWDHHDDPAKSQPVMMGKRRAKDTVGYLTGFKRDGDAAEIEINVPRDEDAEKVKANLAYVSPVIFDSWKDGKGVVHEDCITHVDLVQHPVDNSQSPFEAIHCAVRMGLDSGNPETLVAGKKKPKGPKGKPPKPKKQEIVRLADDQTMEGASRLNKVIEALKRMKIVLPDDTNLENFFARVESALLTAAAMEDDMSDLEESQEFAALSLESQKYKAHADKQHRASVATRLSALLESGRCTPAEHKTRSEGLGAVKLSLDNEGNHQAGQLEAWIESREAVPEGTFFEGRTRMALEEVTPPTMGEEVGSDKEADELIDSIFKR